MVPKDPRKDILPEPVKVNDATPIWTVGQVEWFLAILKNQEKKGANGDWSMPYMPHIEECYKLKKRINRVYSIDNSDCYYYFSAINKSRDVGLDEVEKLVRFFEFKAKYLPELYSIFVYHQF